MVRETVEFETNLWAYGESMDFDDIQRRARTAERSGFDVLWTGEHIAFPKNIEGTEPFSPTGEPIPEPTDFVYDYFQQLAAAATVTDELTVRSGVTIPALRHPVDLTKRMLSLDALSNGRTEFAVGAGWLETEFEIFDVPFEERGSRLDEFLEVFTRACEEPEFAFDGQHHSFQETCFYPRPDSDPRPTLWIGGGSGATFRRIGQFGDGWDAIEIDPDNIAEAKKRFGRAWDDFDRDGEPQISAAVLVYQDYNPLARDIEVSEPVPELRPPEDIIADIEPLLDVGVNRISLSTLGLAGPYDIGSDESYAQLETLGEEVISYFK